METSLNWLAIGVCSLLMFTGGAVWHGPIFGKLWMKIHHGDRKFTEEENAKLMEGMWKLILSEFIASLFTIVTLAFLIKMLPSLSGAHIGFLVWIGFVLPTLISSIIWGGDKREWMLTKISITGSYRLLMLVMIAHILSVW